MREYGLSWFAKKCARITLVILACAVAISCSEVPPIAPSGSVIEVSVAPSTIGADGDTAMVSVYLIESDGLPVPDGTVVVLTATGATLCAASSHLPWIIDPEAIPQSCAQRADDAWPTIVELRTKAGVATALVRSLSPGSVQIRARSGSTNGSTTVTVSAIVAPTGSKIVIDSNLDEVDIGESAEITAFLTHEGTPVVDGTYVVFTSPRSDELQRRIVLTRNGFARTTFTGRVAGNTEVSSRSGTAEAKVTVVVK